MVDEITGGCLCGEVRYATSATPLNVRVCHCRLCQKATGAAFYARVQVPLAGLAISGPTGWHHSSPELRRGFCTQCGTSLFTERASAGMIGLAMGSLDDPDRFEPTDQIFTDSRQAWLRLDSPPGHPGPMPA